MKIRTSLFIAPMLLLAGLSSVARAQTVTPLSEQGLDSLLRVRSDRPLVLNLWATWCEPCREEFPDWMKIAREFPAVDAAALSVDYPDETDSKIRPFLGGLGPVSVPIFVSAAKSQEAVINRLSAKWNGALPATFIFRRTGDADTFYVGKRTPEQFRDIFTRAAASGR